MSLLMKDYSYTHGLKGHLQNKMRAHTHGVLSVQDELRDCQYVGDQDSGFEKTRTQVRVLANRKA